MSQSKPVQGRFSRRTLNIIILTTSVMIVLFYNIPGSRKPTQPIESETTTLNDVESAELFAEAAPPMLTSLKIIESKQPKSHSVDIKSWNTLKGAKVLFVESHEVPMLDVRLVLNAGAARDGDKPGIAYLVNSMLNEGTENLSVDDIARKFEGLGASFSNGSYRDMAIASLRTLSDPKLSHEALSVFYEIVAKPSFPEENLNRIRDQILLSLQRDLQSPKAQISQSFNENLYGNNPYAHEEKGTHDSLNAMTASDLKQFHDTFYVASNTVIAIVGDITQEQAKGISGEVDQWLTRGNPAPRLPSPDLLDSSKNVAIDFPSNQSHIMVGALGIKRGDPRWYALNVGNEILGGGGFSSRLNKVIRQDHGLAYSVYSYFSPMAVNGPFAMGLQTRNEESDKALSLLKETLAEFIKEGPTEAEVTEAKKHILNSFPLSVASNSSIVDNLGAIGFYDLPLDYLDQYPRLVAKVTRADIISAFQSLIDPEKMLTVVLKPAEPKPEAAQSEPKTPASAPAG